MHPSSPRLRRSGRPLLLALLFGLLPLSTAPAQDVDAVGRRLREAVEAGEITAEQARAMLDTLRKHSEQEPPKTITKEAYEVYSQEIRKAVEAGKLSPEDGRAKLRELRAMVGTASDHGEDHDRKEAESRRLTKEDYLRAEAELKKMVEAGKAPAEDARRRLAEMRRIIGEPPERKQADKEAAARKKEAALREQKMAELKKKYAAFETEIHAAVRSGWLGKEEAERKLIQLRERMFRDF